uniref:Beta-defensin n=1 Tax=Gasterosteus aculeatus aculeatus TaxID=481459 RepID=A0AAQ4PNW5_GASAC
MKVDAFKQRSHSRCKRPAFILKASGHDPEMQYWTCGYRGLCRRFCYAQEYIVGHHGCPRRYRCCAVRSYHQHGPDVFSAA